MKLLRALITFVVVGTALLSQVAQAASDSQTFNVTVNLASKCYINLTSGGSGAIAGGAVTFNYTAFQTTDADASRSFKVTCTNTLPITSVAVTAAGAAPVNYFVNLTAAATPTYVNSGGTVSIAGGVGNGTTGLDYTVAVRAPKDQAGTCATATCTATNLHTVLVTY